MTERVLTIKRYSREMIPIITHSSRPVQRHNGYPLRVEVEPLKQQIRAQSRNGFRTCTPS